MKNGTQIYVETERDTKKERQGVTRRRRQRKRKREIEREMDNEKERQRKGLFN
jgi:hypothetical protein